jgi:hypothetical protein
MRKNRFFLFILVFVGLSITEPLLGIPAFARKYKMSCNVCHSPFPRLKEYGEEFAANGFVLKDKDSPRYFTDTGDDTLSLIKSLPIAVRMEGFALYNNSNQETVDFAAPYLIKLLSGGTIARNISYYFYFFLGERGKVAGLEDAFIVFGDIFKSGISVTLGQFQVSDPLFKRELRLTFEDYHIYKSQPGLSNINLTYDRGVIISGGLKTGTDITLEIVNGSGIEEADFFKNFDTDKYKNVFGRLSQGIGDHLRFGACAYYGKEAPGDPAHVNEVWMVGADATFSVPDFMFNVQYLERNDDNPLFEETVNAGMEIKTRGGFAEAVFTPRGDKGKWYTVGLLNWADSDEPALDYRSLSVHIGVLLRRNIRLVGEYSHIFKSHQGKHSRAGIGLITAF